ncbi:MAG: corrinoid protein [Phycisphaerales bacterium]|nr:MAG: corrinoid protein [Phycisphaerales bacterium]
MSESLLSRIARCVEVGKCDAEAKYPPAMVGEPGVDELVRQALNEGVPAEQILKEGLTAGMSVIGVKFRDNEVFVPEVLMAARAMHRGMDHLRDSFVDGSAPSRGTIVVGTVQGDMHDIGKNLVCMMLEGAGWKVIDLGVDCPPEKFAGAVAENPGCAVGLSALLTTTMVNMRSAIEAIRQKQPGTVVLVGGAPVTDDFARQITASGYAADPQGAIELLDELLPAA